ncbi:DUF6452 family protein [Winogradskyella ursingii]|uniref:DUF6452 family protein n=1 Tax=Winogradskyella ursingii TaxID=2686079 RepID=UPI0015C7D8B5|nr:DUF6452 family protein [Winogradskyella ursingii]
MKLVNRIKTTIPIGIALLLVMTLNGCERDDICAESTQTTPRLLIEFYDVTDQENLKSVTRLTAYGEGLVENPPLESNDATLVFNSNVDALELPLRIGIENETSTTRFILEKDTNLRLDENEATASNVDIIEINYTNIFEYVSRACGYKSIFTDLVVTRELDEDNWIDNINIVTTTIENENTVHVQIFH